MTEQQHTYESILKELENDDKVKLAGIDADGMLRGSLPASPRFPLAAPLTPDQAKSSPSKNSTRSLKMASVSVP
jgi:hypothetical protein